MVTTGGGSQRSGSVPGPPASRQEWVASRLREAILSGESPPGQPIRVNELAASWSVSPTPLREALHRLRVEGLVEYEANKGARAATVSVDEAAEILDLRMLLEPLANKSSLSRRGTEGPPDWRDGVRQCYEDLREAFADRSLGQAEKERAHRAFHLELARSCRSSWLLRFIELLLDQSVRYRMIAWDAEYYEGAVADRHLPLFEAYMSGDATAVHELTVSHITEVRDLQLQRLQERGCRSARPAPLVGGGEIDAAVPVVGPTLEV